MQAYVVVVCFHECFEMCVGGTFWEYVQAYVVVVYVFMNVLECVLVVHFGNMYRHML